VQTYCKPCMKNRNAEYYKKTPERNDQRQISRRLAIKTAREFVWQYLLNHPCVDCGENNPVVLEFDHISGVKVLAISAMVGRGTGVETITKEIEKCEVRCANCHRIVTSQRLGWYAGLNNID